jgi:hypothetical protein
MRSAAGRTAQRLANLISIFCIESWRIFWMTKLNRAAPDAPPDLALTATEIRLLDNVPPDTIAVKQQKLPHYLIEIARLGGYRASDRPEISSYGEDCPVSATSR